MWFWKWQPMLVNICKLPGKFKKRGCRRKMGKKLCPNTCIGPFYWQLSAITSWICSRRTISMFLKKNSDRQVMSKSPTPCINQLNQANFDTDW